ncbi:DUF4179 domain-containing protein [Clostridium tyrobutyricum]|jgi:hypothetical protein|uniref:DUF4179 domain-containing protein n=1 Tax=Clostridium tyrobutyricum TaxID=1519 RepID=UPI00057C4E52|nr:DUF4179 domain-containing protein [Clostridium tyrobutyricum]MBV4446564.1 DUF4179 domain-containing protein [Clostridium tyrobutyricum]
MNKDDFNEKDILKLLNYVESNGNYKDEMDIRLDDFRKRQLRKKLMKNIVDKNSKKKYKIAAVACIILISICFTVPTFAKNIPVINSIIQNLKDKEGIDGDYKKYSKQLENSATDNGITLKVKEIICDDNTLEVAYTLTSKDDIRDLVDMSRRKKNAMPLFLGTYLKINGQFSPASGSGGTGKYLDKHTYLSYDDINISDKNLSNTFNINLDVKEIYGVKGSWKLDFNVSREDISRKTAVFEPNTFAKLPEEDINIRKVSISPIGTYILGDGKFTKKESNSDLPVYWFIFDDKGKQIIEYSMMQKSDDGNVFQFNRNLARLNYIPRYLTVIPYQLEISKIHGGNLKPIDGKYPIEIIQSKVGKLVIKEIVSEGNKTIVKYTAEGLVPYSQARELYIKDDKKNVITPKAEINEVKRSNSNSVDYTLEFPMLDKNKMYFIGSTSFFDNINIRNDLKFRIDLKK